MKITVDINALELMKLPYARYLYYKICDKT